MSDPDLLHSSPGGTDGDSGASREERLTAAVRDMVLRSPRLCAIAGGAAGPWVTGMLHDVTGEYASGFTVGIACTVLSTVAIWCAAPRNAPAVSTKR